MKLALIILASACGTWGDNRIPPQPYVQVDVEEIPYQREWLHGARAWQPLGFEIRHEPSPLPECDRRWYEDTVDCQIIVRFVLEPHLIEHTGSDGAANRGLRRVYVDDSVLAQTSEYQLILAAHEVGHILLDTPRHTAGGIMGASSSSMQDVDYDLACEAIGVCL